VQFYEVPGLGRLVDLPGYGYANVAKAERSAWDRMARDYLHGRSALAALVLVLDARRRLTSADETLLAFVEPLGLPRLVLLAKSDKLSRSEAIAAAGEVARRLAPAPAQAVLCFSSRRGTGVEETRDWLSRRLEACLRHLKKNPRQGDATGGETP